MFSLILGAHGKNGFRNGLVTTVCCSIISSFIFRYVTHPYRPGLFPSSWASYLSTQSFIICCRSDWCSYVDSDEAFSAVIRFVGKAGDLYYMRNLLPNRRIQSTITFSMRTETRCTRKLIETLHGLTVLTTWTIRRLLRMQQADSTSKSVECYSPMLFFIV